MSHKNAPPMTREQRRFEAFWIERLAKHGATCGFGRDKRGDYLAEFARDAWAAWQAAGDAAVGQEPPA